MSAFTALDRVSDQCDILPGHGVSSDLAAGANGLLSAQGMEWRDRKGGRHQRGPGPRCDPQPQRRWVQLALLEVQGRPPAEVHLWVSGGRSRSSPHPARPTMAAVSTYGLSKLAELRVAER